MRYHSYEEWENAIDSLRVNCACLCPACQQESSTTLVDFGIGNNEYWGCVTCDRNVRLVSRCCEADVGQDDLLE